MYRIALLGLGMLIGGPALAQQDVSNTLHNMSISGPGAVKSLTIDQVCVFCHAPHNAEPEAPLWNRLSSGETYVEYGSTTLDALPGQPAGSSRLCLSCHDGTIALGAMVNPPFGVVNDMTNTRISGRANIGTDLHDDHPISFAYTVGLTTLEPELANPAGVDLPLENENVECGTCHDPHRADIVPFLRKSTLNGELCTTCHVRAGATWAWATASHAVSTATPTGADPWAERKAAWKGTTVAENACFNCHTPHNAAAPARLLKDSEENTCFRCHDGSVATGDVQADFAKTSRHPIEITPNPDHDAMKLENPLTMSLHVECMDCHNPHATSADLPMFTLNPTNPADSNHTIAPEVNGRIKGVTGVDINGAVKAEIDFQYEMCFKCHGLPGKSSCGTGRCNLAATNNMTRLDGVYNLRDKFDPGNPALVSYHPVVANNPNNNGEVPSLKAFLNRNDSQIYCTDCHNSDQSIAGGGTRPAGPHGSIHEPILAQRLSLLPQDNNAPADYELCLKCHNEASLSGNDSFKHRSHVFNRGASCLACHDPHGSAVYPHLLNFQTSTDYSGATLTITGAGIYAEPTWIDDGVNKGTCWMTCHGSTHGGRSYK